MTNRTIDPMPRSTRQPGLAIRQRGDLQAVVTRHRNESAVVIKDPVAMKYFRLRPDEYFVLQQLDGSRSLQQLCDLYQARFKPWRVTPVEMNQLLFRLHRCGLTISDAALQGDRLGDRRRQERRQQWTQHLSGILFIRFPGIDPEPILRRLYPRVSPLLTRWGFVFAAMLCLAAAVTFVSRWDQLRFEFPAMAQWLRFDALVTLALVIAGTKVIHELGHAVLCKHFGGECHQIGPMLLVFTPALYCDTSDSWMLSNRWQRAAVGMAGIAAEGLLAAIATLVWAFTAPGTLHFLSMNVMLVCSVSTLVINANPLLRYDGYYVLSDLVDVPNLAEKSRTQLTELFNRLLFGVNASADRSVSWQTRCWLLTYAVLAATYRWGLTLLILWFVSLMLRPYGLESVGRLLCVAAVAGLLYSLLRGPVRFLRNPAKRRMIRSRQLTRSAVVLVLLAGLLSIPLPSRVTAPARIVPREEIPLYINTGGLLSAVHARPGMDVSEGDEIARLVNYQVDLEFQRANSRYESQRRIVESLQRAQVGSPQVAAELPAAKSLLQDLQRQLETRRSRAESLVVRAPASGRLIAAAVRSPTPVSELQLVQWSGDPTDPENLGCFLEPGWELMSLVPGEEWNAELTLNQSAVQRIEIGAEVKLICQADPAEVLRGRVIDLSEREWTPDQHSQRRDDRAAADHQRPSETSYLVLVSLEPVESSSLIAGATAKGSIKAAPMSIATRVMRMLNRLFRFR